MYHIEVLLLLKMNKIIKTTFGHRFWITLEVLFIYWRNLIEMISVHSIDRFLNGIRSSA